MEFINISKNQKEDFNSVVTHPLQSFEWGDFREKTGVKVVRRALVEKGKIKDAFTLTIHKIPKTNFTIGYLPKGNLPSKEIIEELKKIGKEEKCIFIQLEPNVIVNHESRNKNYAKEDKEFNSLIHNSSFIIRKSFHPLFTKYTFVLDLTKSEDELLKSFSSKTRYNIKVAQKHNVEVNENNSDENFKEYLALTKETTDRQKFFAHTPTYHTKMWETLRSQNSNVKTQNFNRLAAHLLTATYMPKDEVITETETSFITFSKDLEIKTPVTLASWILFSFHNYLYYPYGASSSQYRNVMASNLVMWEAIKFGKKMGLKYFDMWGALSQNPDPKDPWFGFHRFKQGYGATHREFVGSYDLVINPALYEIYKVVDKARWAYLKLRKSI